MTRVVAVIIGRAGSRGLPGKNARPLAGRPTVAYSIDAARAAACVDEVLLSTDGDAIADAGHAAGIEVVMRPAELASDTAPVDGAVRHAVADRVASIVVILYANVPVRPPSLIDRAVKTLRDTKADSVQSYADVGKYHPHWMVRLDDDGCVEPYVASPVFRRQDLPPLFIPDGGVIAVRRESLFTVDPAQPHAFLGRDRRGIVNDTGAVIDIDGPADLAVAETLLRDRMAT